MTNSQDATPDALGRRSSLNHRQNTSRSWISSLASPGLGQGTMSPPPMPTITMTWEAKSPASSNRTIKLSHVPISQPPQADADVESKNPGQTPEEKDGETETETETETAPETKEDGRTASVEGIGLGLSEPPITPPLAVNRKPRSLVDGFVNRLSLRGIPRAVTHGQLHDRMSPPARASSHASHFSYRRSAAASPHAFDLKYPQQPLILLAQPPPFGHAHAHAHAHRPFPPSLPPVSESKFGGTASEWGNESRAVLSRVSSFLGELNSLPWVSTRVSVDYIPGESKPEKKSSSWYSISAPSTPSALSHMSQLVPEPWFPPANVSPIVEVPEEEQAGVLGGEGGEHVQQKFGKVKEELQEKSQALQDLRQVVEHQKLHIGSLETEIENLRKNNEELQRTKEDNLHRARSSIRRSLRVPMRDSMRMSMRRTSVRVSRPTSAFLST